MKFKLDENLGKREVALFRESGHDVLTVRDEGLGGESDEVIFHASQSEGRALISLDHDFGQVLRFAPEQSSGIVILEVPPRPTPESLLERVKEFLAILETRPLKNELWIVEPGRVRIHQQDPEEP